jgi:transcriptional regulator with XRE-family HTH domain
VRRVSIRAALRRAREQLDLSQREIGDALSGVTGSAVGQWEAGQTEPRPAVVFALEVELGLDPGTLSRILGYLPDGAKPTDESRKRLPAALTGKLADLTPEELARLDAYIDGLIEGRR